MTLLRRRFNYIVVDMPTAADEAAEAVEKGAAEEDAAKDAAAAVAIAAAAAGAAAGATGVGKAATAGSARSVGTGVESRGVESRGVESRGVESIGSGGYAGLVFSGIGGVWTAISGSQLLTFSELTGQLRFTTNSAVPEIDPATGSSALSLIAGVVALLEQRRRRAKVVA
jgi:hypothetical protein